MYVATYVNERKCSITHSHCLPLLLDIHTYVDEWDDAGTLFSSP